MASLEVGGVTRDALLDGRVHVSQPRHGYRVNIDTVLLAAAIETREGRIAELGCGVGAGLLCIAQRMLATTQLVGLERDAQLASWARANVAESAFGGRIDIIEADAFDPPADLMRLSGVFVNPPFDRANEGRAPSPLKAGARVEERPLAAWVKTWAQRLAGGAAFTLIHRADRLDEILAAFAGHLGGAEIIPVHARADAAALRVIARARKGSRARLRLLSPLILHEPRAQDFTSQAQAILRDGEAIDWG